MVQGGNGFYLSVQDLCTMELLPRIAATGVASVKIEGRLRRSDYVEHAVSAYRMLLDATSEEEFKSLLPAARDRMAHTFGRKWSEGFYTAASAKTLVKHDSLGASGQLCGTVVSAKDAEVFDAQGCVVSPGFIDAHSHSDATLLAAPDAFSKRTQGITTEILGNCGHSLFPVTCAYGRVRRAFPRLPEPRFP